MKTLVTGGAGFIGSRLVNALASMGHEVIVLDNLLPQVHGDNAEFPKFPANARAIRGDVRDAVLVKQLLTEGVGVVYHLAAMTGVGQSMYQIDNYVDINSRGTAILLEAIAETTNRPEKIVLSSSRAVYGEGRNHCPACKLDFFPGLRPESCLAAQVWDHPCPQCGNPSQPLETQEYSPLQPTSVYGVTKLEQENLCSVVGEAYEIPVTVLRYFNVYGPGQSPTNPYTGILSIFARRLRAGQPLEIYEDGQQVRDFVYVDDVVRANIIAGQSGGKGVFNVASGEVLSVFAVAKILCELYGRSERDLNISGRYRVGDIRHCFGSYRRAEQILGYQPTVQLREGLSRLVAWMSEQEIVSGQDPDQRAKQELVARGLFR